MCQHHPPTEVDREHQPPEVVEKRQILTEVVLESSNWLFKNWSDVLRILVVGVASYAGLVLFLRISGKRTLSKMNAFDFVITVAFGSTVATILLNTRVSLVEGLTALALLILMQYSVAFFNSQSQLLHRITKSEPRMLFYKGEFLDDALKHERVARSEVLQAIRSSGNESVESIEAVILETNGYFSVVTTKQDSESALGNVNRPDRTRH